MDDFGIIITKDNNFITRVIFTKGKEDFLDSIKNKKDKYIENPAIFKNEKEQFYEYFQGKRKHFNIIYKLNLPAFFKRVLEEVIKIPYGMVTTYQNLSSRLGAKKAYRATGNALAANPLPIIIPCHRVIKSDRTIGGFGGKPDIKIYLLRLEGIPVSNSKVPEEYIV